MLEIVDTGVKIGLGAIVSGIATCVVTRAKNRYDIDKEAKARRSTLLERVSISIQDTTDNIYPTDQQSFSEKVFSVEAIEKATSCVC